MSNTLHCMCAALALLSLVPQQVRADDDELVLPKGRKSFLLFKKFGGKVADAEKSKPNTDDDWLCWAAGAANGLAWTGWGRAAGFKDEDAVFEHFQKHWTDHASGSPRRAWYWFFKGKDPSPKGAMVDQPGGGAFLPGLHLAEKTWTNTPGAVYRGVGKSTIKSKPLTLKTLLDAGYYVSIQIVMPLPKGDRDSHVVSLWGYSYDRQDPFRGVYITDSDDDKKTQNGPTARNRLRHYDVTFKDGRWWFSDASDKKGWHIIAGYALARMTRKHRVKRR
jgi:hypothetical protein